MSREGARCTRTIVTELSTVTAAHNRLRAIELCHVWVGPLTPWMYCLAMGLISHYQQVVHTAIFALQPSLITRGSR